jgi:hypothetical protein
MEVAKVLSERRYKAGYVVRHEIWTHMGNEPTPMKSAYSPSGDYIGRSVDAYRLCVKRGIAPEKRPGSQAHAPCSIGWCEREQKWYGWSHRAIYGFGIGAKITKNHVAYGSEESGGLPLGFTAQTLDDAKRIAIAFASGVS